MSNKNIRLKLKSLKLWTSIENLKLGVVYVYEIFLSLNKIIS